MILPAFALFLQIALTHEWNSETYPNAVTQRQECHSPDAPFFCDPDDLLEPSARDEVGQHLRVLTQDYTIGCAKAVMGVALARNVDLTGADLQSPEESNNDVMRRIATKIFDRWQIGSSDCSNGIMLLLAVETRKMQLVTGSGARDVVTDRRAKLILDSIKPLLREGKIQAAVEHVIFAVGHLAKGEELPMSWWDWIWGDLNEDLLWFGLFGLFIFISIILEAKKKLSPTRRACQVKLSALESERAQALADKYMATSCPICLENFPEKTANDSSAPNPVDAVVSDQARDGPIEVADTVDQIIGEGILRKRTPPQSPLESGDSSGDIEYNALDAESVEEDDPDAVTLLRCGHIFHNSCLKDWEGNSCPICREVIVSGEAEAIEEPQNTGWDLYQPEYDFRLRRLHHFYPDQINMTMVDTFRSSQHSSLVTRDQFVSSESYANPSTSWGNTFEGISGGTSFGGGGAGGDW